jgi:hypothetical protein
LICGSAAILHQVAEDDAVIALAEAATRGWVQQQNVGYRLSGAEASRRLLPILGQLGSLYNKGAKATIGVLDIVDLEIEGSARLRISLENATPAAMKSLGELFEVLAGVAKPGAKTSVEFEVSEPDDNCLLIKRLKEGAR